MRRPFLGRGVVSSLLCRWSKGEKEEEEMGRSADSHLPLSHTHFMETAANVQLNRSTDLTFFALFYFFSYINTETNAQDPI